MKKEQMNLYDIASLIQKNRNAIDELKQELALMATQESKAKKWLKPKEVMDLLGIKQTKLWELEKQGVIIPRRPFGNAKKYYDIEVIYKLIENGKT